MSRLRPLNKNFCARSFNKWPNSSIRSSSERMLYSFSPTNILIFYHLVYFATVSWGLEDVRVFKKHKAENKVEKLNLTLRDHSHISLLFFWQFTCKVGIWTSKQVLRFVRKLWRQRCGTHRKKFAGRWRDAVWQDVTGIVSLSIFSIWSPISFGGNNCFSYNKIWQTWKLFLIISQCKQTNSWLENWKVRCDSTL